MVALNTSADMSSDTLNNHANFTWADGSVTAQTPVTIVEPKLSVVVTPSVTSGQAGTPVTYTLVVSNPTGTYGAEAFNAALTNVIPNGVTINPATLQFVGGVPPIGGEPTLSGDTITANYASLLMGESSTITFQGVLNNSVSPLQPLVDNATVTWTSLRVPTSWVATSRIRT